MNRKQKINRAKEVRIVSRNLQELVNLGIITKSERKANLRTIGKRIRYDNIRRKFGGF